MAQLDRFKSKGDAYWQEVKDAWQAASLAGQSAAAFCRTRAIAPDTFNKKLRRWRSEATEAQAQVLLRAPAAGKDRQTGKAGGSGLNAVISPPANYLPPQHSSGRPSTVQAQETIEQAAAEAARHLVASIKAGGQVGLKAGLEVLDRSGVLKAKEQSKATPYSTWTPEQLAARLAVLAPQALRAAEAAEGSAA